MKNCKTRARLWACVLAGLSLAAAAQSEDASRQADELYRDGSWDEAAAAYRAITESNPADGRAWYRLGVSLRHTGDYEQAAAALETAQENGVPAGFASYELARVYILQDEPAAALEWLAQSAAAGNRNYQALEADADFAELREHERFPGIVAQMRKNAMPCEQNERFRQFDFWIGEWEVFGPAGNKAGENSIRKAEQGCLVLESWSGVTGGTGTSMNYYDPVREKWIQVWVSSGGTLIEIEGGLDDGSMRLSGSIYYVPRGTGGAFRGTWTPLPDGRVRQFFEQSPDGGETWSPWFEGYYVRKDKVSANH